MKTLLYVANLVATGQLDIENATQIKTYSQCIEVLNGSNYIDGYDLDGERLGPDKYEFELDRGTFEPQEIQDYINSGQCVVDFHNYENKRQEAVKRVAELIAQVSPAMNELLTLANEYNIPADIKVGKYTNDFRLIDAVDWDSSSMYC